MSDILEKQFCGSKGILYNAVREYMKENKDCKKCNELLAIIENIEGALPDEWLELSRKALLHYRNVCNDKIQLLDPESSGGFSPPCLGVNPDEPSSFGFSENDENIDPDKDRVCLEENSWEAYILSICEHIYL